MITLLERFLRLRCSSNQTIAFLRKSNSRHKNRFTMYCIKADSEDNPWNIWNHKRFVRFWFQPHLLVFCPSVASNRRDTEFFLIVRDARDNKNSWWVRKNSNLRPSLYQSDILTNWTTDPIVKNSETGSNSADTRIFVQKEIFRQSHSDLTVFVITVFSIKEVIQPHLPVLLPCYDLTPITNPTVGGVLLR